MPTDPIVTAQPEPVVEPQRPKCPEIWIYLYLAGKCWLTYDDDFETREGAEKAAQADIELCYSRAYRLVRIPAEE